MDNVYRATSRRLVGASLHRTTLLTALWLIAGGCTTEVSEPDQQMLFAGRTALMNDGPVVEATDLEQKMQLWATVESGTLYVQITGFPSNHHFNLLIDTDDAASGFDSSDWFTDSGADYLVADAVTGNRRTATIAAYVGPGFEWQKPALADARVDAQFASSSVSVNVALELLGIKSWDRPIGLGFQVVGEDWKAKAQLPGKPKFAKLDPSGRKWDSLNCRYADEILPVAAPPLQGSVRPDYEVRNRGIVIPAYVTPDVTTEWTLLEQGAVAMGGAGDYYVVVAGGDKGPPDAKGFDDFRPQWDAIRKAGGRIFGYIHPCIDCLKDEAVRTAQFEPLSKLEADVASWVRGYPELDGIWIDEFYPQYELKKPGSTANGGFWNGPQNAPSERCFENVDGKVHASADVEPTGGYFDQLTKSIRGNHPQLRIIGNVGTRLISNLELYGNLVDVLVSFEQSIGTAKANDWKGLTPPLAKVKRPQLALIHEALTIDEMTRSVQEVFKLGYTHVYATDGLYSGNAWGHVTPYLLKEVAAITGKPVEPGSTPSTMSPASMNPATMTPGAMTVPTRTQVTDTSADPTRDGGAGTVTVTRDGFTLTFVSEDPQLSAQTALDIQNTFFATIKPESDYFEPNCPHDVTIVVQPMLVCAGQAVPACTWTDEEDRNKAYMLIDGQYITQNPADYDLVTHEAMHVVQSPPAGLDACGYWIEGEADLARAWWGLNNAAASWVLPAPDPTHSYTEGYRVTAAFLEWIYESFGEAPILALDDSLQAGVCPGVELWSAQTGYASVDVLWADYVNGAAPAADPAVDPSTAAGPSTAAEPTPAADPSIAASPSSAAEPAPASDASSDADPSVEPEADADADPPADAASPDESDAESESDSAEEAEPETEAEAEADSEPADADVQPEADEDSVF
jgi:hypothetical protein